MAVRNIATSVKQPKVKPLESYKITGTLESAPRGPKFYLYPTDIEILGFTSEVYLECAATGLTQPTYQWTVTREDGQTQPIVGPRCIVTNGRVTISNPQVALDGGSYQCRAKNEFGVVLTPPVVLSFADLGEFSNVDTAPIRPLEYQGTVIQCPKITSTSSLSISYNWIKDQTTPINSRLTPYLFLSGDGQLYFSEVTRGDNGMYYCMATLTYPTDRDKYAGSFQSPSRISTGIPLQVQGAPSGILNVQIPDSFIQVFPRQPVVGVDWTSSVPVVSPDPQRSRDQVRFTDSDRVLTILGVTLQDAGVYTCVCSSRRSGTKDQKTFHLATEAKPVFTVPLRDQHADRESELVWRCQAFGIPRPTYTWYRNGQLLSGDSDLVITGNTLTIPRLGEGQAGMYQCMASNSHGVVTSTAQLRVLYQFTISCHRNVSWEIFTCGKQCILLEALDVKSLDDLGITLAFFSSCPFVIKMAEFLSVKDFCSALVRWATSIVFVNSTGFCLDWSKDLDLSLVVFFITLTSIVFTAEQAMFSVGWRSRVLDITCDGPRELGHVNVDSCLNFL
uniref:Ig-like domain-containing protein n=1 Tax=Magallana gigas TaxID=29159 RepID=A0A8W8LNB3_MAGGI